MAWNADISRYRSANKILILFLLTKNENFRLYNVIFSCLYITKFFHTFI